MKMLQCDRMTETLPIDSLAELEALADQVYARATTQEPQSGAFVVALNGDLGSGKTTFTQLLAKQFGVTETVNSPTFVIMKHYPIEVADYRHFVHIDAYRLESVDELAVLGFAELLQQKDTIICIEWADQVAPLLPAERLTIDFALASKERTATITYAQSN